MLNTTLGSYLELSNCRQCQTILPLFKIHFTKRIGEGLNLKFKPFELYKREQKKEKEKMIRTKKKGKRT
jgi:hypothetical protein